VIPRIFHRVWLGDQQMPEEYKRFGDTWLSLHPDWKMIEWSDITIPKLKNFWAYNQSKSLAGKANIVRYEILLHYGGIYVDTDFECLKSLSSLIEGVSCFVAWQRDGFANNAIIGASPGHPFIQDLVDSLEQNMRSLNGRGRSITESGPYYLTKVLQRHLEVNIFSSQLFYPYEWHERWRRHEKFSNAYAVHHWGLSWKAAYLPKPKQLGDGDAPCLSVIFILSPGCDIVQFEWVLEGLCLQTVQDFEVIVVGDFDCSTLSLLEAFRNRFKEIYFYSTSKQENHSYFHQATSFSRSERTLFLKNSCVPSPKLVESHAKFGSKGFICFSKRRVYPKEKLYSFSPPFDYESFIKHSVENTSHISIYEFVTKKWLHMHSWCFSAPTKNFHLYTKDQEELHLNVSQEALQLMRERNCKLYPLRDVACVTELCDSKELTGKVE
jgi:inositol phosphorylceramide mannosyltransferase catalytic subunit